MASDANGLQIDVLPERTPPSVALLPPQTGGVAEWVNNYPVTTELGELQGYLQRERRIYFKRATGYFRKIGELFMEAPLGSVWGFV